MNIKNNIKELLSKIKSNKKIKKNKLEIAVGSMAAVVIVFGVCSALALTVPYALAADGEKVTDPWVVTIGGEEKYIVASEEEGQAVIDGLEQAYATEGGKILESDLEPQVEVIEKDLKRGDKPLTVTEPETAVEEIVAANETEEPMVVVTLTEKVAADEEIEYETTYKENEDLYVGRSNVLEEGENGEQTVVSEVTAQNGEVIDEKVLDTTVIKEPKDKVVEKGTKAMTPAIATQVVNNGGVAIGITSGSNVCGYAMNFLGNPYVWGGTSLTNGTDCSGFVMSVYAHYGIKLPHSSRAQAKVGKAVTLSQAKPGDIVCYPGHVGLYIGNGKIIHASTPKTGIKISRANYRPISTIRRVVE